jgi:hypothetical protein
LAFSVGNCRPYAARAGVPLINVETLENWRQDSTRTLYLLDVRTPEEYAASHAPGFTSAPDGQLMQATDKWAVVRGASFVLFDTDWVRARSTAT